jgi:hypothetical protein
MADMVAGKKKTKEGDYIYHSLTPFGPLAYMCRGGDGGRRRKEEV